jgi:hypothetical protein
MADSCCAVLSAVQDYATYIAVLYILSSLVLFCLAVTGWVAVALKKDDSSGGWMQKWVPYCCILHYRQSPSILA